VDGVDALKIWGEEKGAFDLVLTDMVMPNGISGVDLCALLRKTKPGLKAIVSSGYCAEKLEGVPVLGEPISFLPKPYDVVTLATTVRACLDGKA
jgi:CheY-like chemotaxis protein